MHAVATAERRRGERRRLAEKCILKRDLRSAEMRCEGGDVERNWFSRDKDARRRVVQCWPSRLEQAKERKGDEDEGSEVTVAVG